MRDGVLLSGTLHVVVLLLVLFGLPFFWEPETVHMTATPITVVTSDQLTAPKVVQEQRTDVPQEKPPEPEIPLAPPAPTLPEPEVIGLLSLMLLHESRRPARVNPDGDLVLLDEADDVLVLRADGRFETTLNLADLPARGVEITEAHRQGLTVTDARTVAEFYDPADVLQWVTESLTERYPAVDFSAVYD